MYLSETHEKKWQPVLEHADLPKIGDSYRRAVTATILENQERAIAEEGKILTETLQTTGYTGGDTATGPVAGFDPVLISLIRRSMPQLIAYDVAGVQPMTGPTGLIFAMKSQYVASDGTKTEALFDEANTAFSGDTTVTQEQGPSGLETAADDGDGDLGTGETAGEIVSDYAGGLSTADAEALGTGGSGGAFGEMAFKIEKSTVIGELLAKRAKEKKISEVYFDRGECKYHGRVKLFAETLRKNGLKF